MQIRHPTSPEIARHVSDDQVPRWITAGWEPADHTPTGTDPPTTGAIPGPAPDARTPSTPRRKEHHHAELP